MTKVVYAADVSLARLPAIAKLSLTQGTAQCAQLDNAYVLVRFAILASLATPMTENWTSRSSCLHRRMILPPNRHGKRHNSCISGWKPGRTQHCFPSPEEMWGDGGLAEQQWLRDDENKEQCSSMNAESECSLTAPFTGHEPSAELVRGITNDGNSYPKNTSTHAAISGSRSELCQAVHTNSRNRSTIEPDKCDFPVGPCCPTNDLIHKSCVARPHCRCHCGCQKRPGRRIQCPACLRLVGPGCCWVIDSTRCHKCLTVEPDPEPALIIAAHG